MENPAPTQAAEKASPSNACTIPFIPPLPPAPSQKINWKLTEENRNKEFAKGYMEWMKANLLISDAVDWPVVFEGGLRGAAAKRDIKPFEGIIAVPQKFLVMSRRAREDPELQEVWKDHPAIFALGATDICDYEVTIFFMIRERLKGKQSLYYYVIEVVDQGDLYPWLNPTVISYAHDVRVKEEIRLQKEKLDICWKIAEPIFDQYPKIFHRKITFEDYLWAYHFVNSRCFGWDMPSLVYTPLIDLLNHSEMDNPFHCTFLHTKKDKLPSEEAKKLNYDKLPPYLDLRSLFPDWPLDTGYAIKPDSIDLYDELTGVNFKEYRSMNDSQCHQLVCQKAWDTLRAKPDFHIWQIPDWVGELYEANDDGEDRQKEYEFPQLLRSFKDRMDFPAQHTAPPPFTPFTSPHLAGINPAGEVESEYLPEKHPWYDSKDPDVYFLCWNMFDIAVPAGAELNLYYGPKTNLFFYKWYGFALHNNRYDSLQFRMIDGEMIYGQDGRLDLAIPPGTSFRTKLHRLDYALLAYLREQLVKSSPTKTSNSASNCSIPLHSLADELQVLQRYQALFSTWVQTHSRGGHSFAKEFERWEKGELSYGQYAILLCEYSYLRIACRQMEFLQFALSILKEYAEAGMDKEKLKGIYMRDRETQPSGMTSYDYRQGISLYLQQLYHHPPKQ
jgi:hypothetical protein